ncbi:M16 family metallopeptidase [Pseudofrankia asymbiotica]|uniref:Peptidase M16 n=1 Tax=Pseudofrankia asymbiotica TaxID=1834516 RepID=A0A1V2ILC8_9ACTN|nr:pitrilysin family protein [Pseudofrankia asymbiotica]ONH33825.1 peptidase M16 [Pseudofrankia asymbiotica]
MTTTTERASIIPAVRPTVPAELPTVVERTLPSGLRVLVVARTSVPLVELRLRIPFTGLGTDFAAQAELLAETLFTGTAKRDRVEIATAVQALGGSLSTGVDADRLAVVGSALATNLDPLLGILAEVLTEASYPDDEFSGERDRVVEDATMALSQPAVIAREALLRRMFPGHPYGSVVAEPAVLAGVGVGAVRDLHTARISPRGAILTLVGDVDPAAALDAVEAALGGWSGGEPEVMPAVPALATGPILIVNRPGAVQTNIRLGGAALDRHDPGYPTQRLANTIFGGYFSSRLVDNIREDKGYTYSPRSSVDHYLAGSRFTAAADVATDVTGPALLEIFYELGRMAVLAPESEELEAARQYSVGTMALGSATAAGLASTLSGLAGAGIGVEYLRDHPAALTKVTAEDVLAVSAGLLAPTRLVTVLVGDAEKITGAVAALGAVTTAVIDQPTAS